MKLFARLRPLMAALLALLVLAGCSSAPQATPTPKITDKPVDLNIYLSMGFNREALDEAIRTYTKKNPNVTIKVKELRGGGGGNTFTQDGQVNISLYEGADLVIMQDSQAKALWSAGHLRDLSSLRMPALNDLVADLFDDASKVDGKRFGLPLTITPSMFSINPNAFQQAGVEVPSLDWTLAEYEAKMGALKAAGGNAALNLFFVWEPVMRAFGAKSYDSATGTWTLDTPQAKEAISWMARQVKAGIFEFSTQGGGNIVFRVGGGPGGQGGGRNQTAIAPMLAGIGFGGPQQQLQPYPKGPKGRASSVSATVGVVLKNAAQPEVATDFLREMLSNAEIQIALAKGGIRPVTNDAKALAAWKETVGSRSADAIELSLPNAYVGNPPNLNQAISGFAAYFEGKATLDEVLPGVMANLNK